MAKTISMNRRTFLQTGATAALAWSALPHYAADFGDMKKRVGLIGCGWYGKIDLFRLIQIAPVEVVSLCDVDRRMLNEAAEMTAAQWAQHLQGAGADLGGEERIFGDDAVSGKKPSAELPRPRPRRLGSRAGRTGVVAARRIRAGRDQVDERAGKGERG